MAKFTLLPCVVREDRISPKGEPPIVLQWEEMAKRFAPSQDRNALTLLLRLRPTGYVGLVRDERGVPRAFSLFVTSRNNHIRWHIKRDPMFAERVLEIYRVEAVELDARLLDMSAKEPPGPAPAIPGKSIPVGGPVVFT